MSDDDTNVWLVKVEVLANVQARTPDEAILKLHRSLEGAGFYADPAGDSKAYDADPRAKIDLR